MGEIERFYLSVIAQLNVAQTTKMKSERLLPINVFTKKNGRETMRQRKLFKKAEKQRNKIEKGYYKGIKTAQEILNKEFKRCLKCLNNSD